LGKKKEESTSERKYSIWTKQGKKSFDRGLIPNQWRGKSDYLEMGEKKGSKRQTWGTKRKISSYGSNESDPESKSDWEKKKKEKNGSSIRSREELRSSES